MIDFTKFDASTGQILAHCTTSHAELIGAQLAVGEGAALGRHDTAATLFISGKALVRTTAGEIDLIDHLKASTTFAH